MPSTNATNPAQALSQDTQNIVGAFEKLSTDDKLALLYFVYEKMGSSITPAAPTAAEPELAPILLGDFFNLSDQEQLEIMRDIVNRRDTQYSRNYGALSPNNQLLVWYAWAVGMGDTVVDLPEGYQATEPVNEALSQIEGLEFEKQISVFREVAQKMGYSEVQRIATQAETGKTSSL